MFHPHTGPTRTTFLGILRVPTPRAPDDGMSTAEYAVATVAAVAFAAVLYAILTSSRVRDALTQIVIDALHTAG